MPGPGDRKQSVGNSSRRKASQSNSSAHGVVSPELGSKPQGSAEGYTPVNNFNSQEVINHFDRTYKAAIESHHHLQGTPNAAKSVMYSGSGAAAWDKVPPKGTMSTGADFLTELRKKTGTAP